MRKLSCAILLALILAGCAERKAVVPPTTTSVPPKPQPAKKQPPPPPAPPTVRPAKKEPSPPLLSPQVSQAEANWLRREAEARIEGATQIVKQIEQKKLAKEQQETFLIVQSFLSKAKEALSIEEFLKAFNLADKAQILAQELLQAPQIRY